MPTKNSFPSTRQYFAIPENCSRCDWMYTRLPTATRAFIRMHAPCAEWFSIRAVTDCTAPDKSSHDASTRIITAVRDSCTAPLIPSSIGKTKEQFNNHLSRSANSEHCFFLICHRVGAAPYGFQGAGFSSLHSVLFLRRPGLQISLRPAGVIPLKLCGP